MRAWKSGVCTAALLLAAGAAPAWSQETVTEDESTERMTVTGSFISGTPEDAALPVSVLGRGELDEIGAPSLNELLRNIGAAQGLIGETNQFDTRGGQGNEGATTINLRGLGSNRTLVLFNGHRQVGDDNIGVDVNSIPLIAVERLEILKDGAAALYGSDAVAGVVNFITRNDFEGIELRGNYQFIEDSDGDWDIGVLAGHNGELWGREFQVMLAGEYGRRSELFIKDRDFALRSFPENPQGGWSSIGNPGTFIPSNGFAGGLFPDPNCNELGGFNAAGFCRFQFTFFDNLIEETETIKIFHTGSYDYADNHTMEWEAMFSRVDLPEWNTSPAYPPQTLLAPGNQVLPDHPGRLAFFDENPAFGANFDPNEPIFFWGRYTGVGGINGGQPETSQRLTEQYRGSVSFLGTIFDGKLNYDISGTYSVRRRSLNDFNDTAVQNFGFALRGLGGPNCDPSAGTPGVGPCEYFNPFSNAIESSAVTGQANPNFNPAVSNSPELLAWLTERGSTADINRQAVIDAVFDGVLPWELPGGEIGFAFGGQIRKDYYEQEVTDNYNLNLNPCPYDDPFAVELGLTPTLDCASPTGRFAFLAGTLPQQLDRNVYALFAELALPLTDTINVQLAARYEDYGGNVGSTLDPKLAIRWQALDWLAMRGSISTTFRGPGLSQLGGRFTTLSFIPPTLAFKAVDTVGNPNLRPESAVTTNIGALFEYGAFTGSIDYWRFDFSDPLQLEDENQLTNAYIGNSCFDGGAGVGTEICDSLRQQIFPTGIAPEFIERIERQFVNGADLVTDGIDFFGQVDFPWQEIDFTVGIQGTYTISFESDDFTNADGFTIAQGGDFVGFLNEGTPFQTLVGLNGNVFAKARWKNHFLQFVARYVSSFEDTNAPSIPELANIESFTTYDLYYTLDLFDGSTRLNLSIFNLTDNDPPSVSNDVNFDPFTHSPFGRMIKIGFIQQF